MCFLHVPGLTTDDRHGSRCIALISGAHLPLRLAAGFLDLISFPLDRMVFFSSFVHGCFPGYNGLGHGRSWALNTHTLTEHRMYEGTGLDFQ